MEEQKFGDREMGRGWIRSEAGGKGGGTAGLTEAQVNGFDQSNGNSLTGKMHHGRMRALDGIGLELSHQQRQQKDGRFHAGTGKCADILQTWPAQCWPTQSQDREFGKLGCPG